MSFWYRLFLGGLSAVAVLPATAQIASLPATLTLHSIDGVIVPFQNGMPLPSFEKQRRPVVDLRGIWRKQRFTANHTLSLGLRDSAGAAALVIEAASRHLPIYSDASWGAKIVPSVENTLKAFISRPEDYENGVWYRRAFTLSDTLQGRFARLNFYAVNYVADVWLNGHYLGYHEGGYTPFSFDATSVLRFDTTNVLAVRVDNPAWGSRNDIVPYGTLGHKPDWFNYTGIIHDVYLEFSNAFSVARAEVVPQSPADYPVQARVTLWNKSGSGRNADLVLEVYEASVDSTTIQSEAAADLLGSSVSAQTLSGIAVPADSAVARSVNLEIPSPKLWSPKHPNLYVLRAALVVGTETVDEVCVQFGVRKLGLSGPTILLNERPMFFPAVARHEDHYLYGRSVPREVIFSDLQKALGVNATLVRTGHYPNHLYTYLIADRLGLAVMEEIPIWWFDENDAWLKQDLLRHIHEQMWREMVFRDRSRPSILFWSTCNECLDQTNRKSFIERLNGELDGQYPDGRFVTQSAAADRPGPADPTQTACDVAGWTMYFGIFHGSTYYAGTKQFLQSIPVSLGKPVVDTEFGYWSRTDLASAAAQVEVFDSTFAAFNEFVAVDSVGTYRPGRPLAATTWWCLFDWYSIQSGEQTMGLYQMDHVTAKPVLARLQSVYRPFRESSETAVLAVEQGAPGLPTGFALEQNFPNPFNPSTIIGYTVPSSGSVRLAVYDILGREAALLVDEMKSPGSYRVGFDGTGLASGVYICRLTAGDRSLARKLVLMR